MPSGNVSPALADQYTGAARLACALVHPGAQGVAEPSRQLLAGDVVRGDPWGWLAAERASLVALVEQVHAAALWDRTWQLAETLPDMFDWRADWRSWKRTHQLALDAARRRRRCDCRGQDLAEPGCPVPGTRPLRRGRHAC